MSAFPNAGSFAPGGAQNVDIAERFEAWLAASKQLPGGAAAPNVEIASGVIAPTTSLVIVDVQGGSAGGLTTDDLDQIVPTNMPDGAVICVRSRAAGRSIVVRHAQGGAGQIFTADGVNLQLSDPSQAWFGVLAPGRASWTELHRSWGNNKTALKSWLALAGGAAMDIPSEAEIRAGTRNDRIMTPLGTAIALGDPALAFINRPFVTTYNLPDQLLVLREVSAGNFQIRRTGLSILLSRTFTASFDSGEIGLGAGAGGTIAAHNLGGMPSLCEFVLRCKTDQHSYVAGEEVPYFGDGFTIGCNTTGLFYRFGNENPPIKVRNKGNGNLVDCTNANWRMIIRLWR